MMTTVEISRSGDLLYKLATAFAIGSVIGLKNSDAVYVKVRVRDACFLIRIDTNDGAPSFFHGDRIEEYAGLLFRELKTTIKIEV